MDEKEARHLALTGLGAMKLVLGAAEFVSAMYSRDYPERVVEWSKDVTEWADLYLKQREALHLARTGAEYLEIHVSLTRAFASPVARSVVENATKIYLEGLDEEAKRITGG
jgi:hypothetical protein